MYILLSILFSAISLFAALKLHDKFDPARYFLLLWAGQIILIYAIFHNSFTFTGQGLVFISIIGITFSIGSLTGHLIGNKIPEEENKNIFNASRSLFFLQICLAIAFINVLFGIYSNGFNIREIFSFKTLLELNSAAADSRYSSNEQSSIVSQFTLIFVYLAPLYGGYLLPMLKGRKKIWTYLTIFPALLISVTQSVKLGFITSIVLWVTGIIISSYSNNLSFFRIKKATVLKITLFSGLFFSILFLSMMFRTGHFDSDTFEYIKQKFVTYAFGHLPVFDSWFTKNMGELDPSGGVKTFWGISNVLGLAERKQGVFSEFVYFWKNINHRIPSDMGTNVYTMFRFILEDFGFIGSFIVMFIGGIISGFSWIIVKRQKNNLLFQTILIAMMFFIFMSFATSVWVYTSYIATIIFFYFLLNISFSKQEVRIATCQQV